ncbi:MAG: hypothetical protein Q3965_06235 [Rothia sp. (in: high G+C Gram-positive bacteria)]|nr:hypothetical protein [Rothia sp. (in: high G+C Gram-positive bacteria)]
MAETGGQISAATDDLLVQDFGDNISAIYNRSQDRALIINSNALEAYLADPAKYGTYLYQNEFISNSKTGVLEVHALFYNSATENCTNPQKNDYGYGLYSSPQQDTVILRGFYQLKLNSGTCFNFNDDKLAVPLSWKEGLLDREPVGTEVDTSYDWSKAHYIPLQ